LSIGSSQSRHLLGDDVCGTVYCAGSGLAIQSGSAPDAVMDDVDGPSPDCGADFFEVENVFRIGLKSAYGAADGRIGALIAALTHLCGRRDFVPGLKLAASIACEQFTPWRDV
jgi:hypothetical protein